MNFPDPNFRESIEAILARPIEQKLREQKYRCAQALVFGLPVIALQYLGPKLGGPESQRWVAMFQAILSGWVTYVAGAGMITEGIVLLLTQRRVTMDLLAALIALGAEIVGIISTAHVFIDGRIWFSPLWFHAVVILFIVWSAVRWFSLSLLRRETATAPESESEEESAE